MTRCTVLIVVAALSACRATQGRSEETAARVEVAPGGGAQSHAGMDDRGDDRAIAMIVCEQYRQAVQSKDVDALLRLAAPDYHDEAGTPDDPSDDVDRVTLREYLLSHFLKADEITYEFEILRVLRAQGELWVDTRYTASFKVVGMTDVWKRFVSEQRMVLVHTATGWRIRSGM